MGTTVLGLIWCALIAGRPNLAWNQPDQNTDNQVQSHNTYRRSAAQVRLTLRVLVGCLDASSPTGYGHSATAAR